MKDFVACGERDACHWIRFIFFLATKSTNYKLDDMRILSLLIVFVLIVSKIHAQYIAEVLEYVPAPGQYTNSKPTGIPSAAKSIVGKVNGFVCLGGFGGYIIWRFDEPVVNNPQNLFGVDFTVFGNPMSDWSEPAIVSVMYDKNHNGKPDDTWFELAGSDYFFNTTVKNYSVNFVNPNQSIATNVYWSDNHNKNGVIIANTYHKQSYYPLIDSFPLVNSVQQTYTGSCIKEFIDTSNSSVYKSNRHLFGYADNSPRGISPFTVPDNPYTNERENAGGDAFDLSWAVDSNGNYVDIDTAHFIKVHNATNCQLGWLGELSSEITGAARVTSVSTVNSLFYTLHIEDITEKLDTNAVFVNAIAFCNGRKIETSNIEFEFSDTNSWIDNESVVHCPHNSELVIKAKLINQPDVFDTLRLNFTNNVKSSNIKGLGNDHLIITPNPVQNTIYLNELNLQKARITDLAGISFPCRIVDNRIDVNNLVPGYYFLSIESKYSLHTMPFIKK